MSFLLSRNFKVHINWDLCEIRPWNNVIILWASWPFYFGPWIALIKDSVIRTHLRFQQPTMLELQWRHNGRVGVSNHQPHDCLLNRLFRRRSKKTSKLHVTGICAVNSPVTGEFPAQMASNPENVFIWWHHQILWVVYHKAEIASFGLTKVSLAWHSFCFDFLATVK